jgi:hypothetical protein
MSLPLHLPYTHNKSSSSFININESQSRNFDNFLPKLELKLTSINFTQSQTQSQSQHNTMTPVKKKFKPKILSNEYFNFSDKTEYLKDLQRKKSKEQKDFKITKLSDIVEELLDKHEYNKIF